MMRDFNNLKMDTLIMLSTIEAIDYQLAHSEDLEDSRKQTYILVAREELRRALAMNGVHYPSLAVDAKVELVAKDISRSNQEVFKDFVRGNKRNIREWD